MMNTILGFDCLRSGLAVAILLLASDVRSQVSVSIATSGAAPGELAIAFVQVEQATGMAGADLAIHLPEFVSAGAVETTAATADFLVASRLQPGRLEISMARATGLTEAKTTILQIPLKISKTAPVGTFTLTFERLQVYDSQPSSVAKQAINGSIAVLPTPQDQDQDGLPDAWEMQHFGSAAGSPERDSDSDGVDDRREFIAGTDPTAADSVFRIVHLQKVDRAGNRAALLQWKGDEGRRYEIQWSSGIFGAGMVWHKIHNPDIRKEAALFSWTDDGTRTYDVAPNSRERFYRILISSDSP